MNSTHALTMTALLALPLVATLGCGAADYDTADDDSAVTGDITPIQPKGVMQIRSDATPPSDQIDPTGGQAVSSTTQSVSTGHGINYNGGTIISKQTNIYYIRYGTWSNSDFTILNNFANDIGGSPYYNINTLYDDSNGNQVVNHVTNGGYVTDSYSQGASLGQSAVFSVVTTAIASGSLPLDANGVYFVLGSADVSQTAGSQAFCTNFCGWHSYGTYNNTAIKYSFVGNPAACPSACIASQIRSSSPNGVPAMDGMVSVIAHELEEAATDPKLNAWYDSSGYENADKCAWNFGSTFTSSNGATANMMLNSHEYLLQQNWLNSGSGSCALTYGQLSAHGGSGGGRFDTACDSGDVAVGLAGRAGSLVDKTGLICAPVNSDGTLSSSTYTTTQYGGSGGAAYSVQCPSGEAIVGLSGRSGSKVDQLGISCSTLSNWKSAGTVQYTATAGGGSGGAAFSETCTQGHALNRITGRSGSLVDQAQGGCARVWPY